MKILWNAKDGGKESKVWCWGIESKRFGSLLLLKFGDGSREAFHSHAFNALSVVLRGLLSETLARVSSDGLWRAFICRVHSAGDVVYTQRSDFHKVRSVGTTWVLSLRGPWADTWLDYDERTGVTSTLTHGRKEVSRG
jgi:hypothetical protein